MKKEREVKGEGGRFSKFLIVYFLSHQLENFYLSIYLSIYLSFACLFINVSVSLFIYQSDFVYIHFSA